MSHVVEKLRELLSAERVVVGEDVGEDYTHDECLTVAPRQIGRASWRERV